VFLAKNRLLDLAFWSNQFVSLIGKLIPFTFSIMIEKYLLILVHQYRTCWLFFIFGIVHLQILLIYGVNHTCYSYLSLIYQFPFWVLFFPNLSGLWLIFFLFHVNYSLEYPLQCRLGGYKQL
jgi:hypothetical protein